MLLLLLLLQTTSCGAWASWSAGPQGGRGSAELVCLPSAGWQVLAPLRFMLLLLPLQY